MCGNTQYLQEMRNTKGAISVEAETKASHQPQKKLEKGKRGNEDTQGPTVAPQLLEAQEPVTDTTHKQLLKNRIINSK